MKAHDWTDRKIEAGQTLTTRSTGDYDCIYKVKVMSRKGQWAILEIDGEQRRKKIELDHNGGEVIYAYGKYSMAPCFRPPPPTVALKL